MNCKFYDWIVRPVATEKSTMIQELRKYSFIILTSVDKKKVKKAIEAIFKVNVLKVNIIKTAGKVKRFKGTLGRQSNQKKAVVTLKEGQSIEFGTNIGGTA